MPVDHNPDSTGVESITAKWRNPCGPTGVAASPIAIVNDRGEMIKPAGENPDDQGVREPAERADADA